MAKLGYLIPIGILKKTKKIIPGHFELKKIIADVLELLNVPYQDECCSNLNNPSPVRYNEATSKLQYYDKDTKVWTDVPTASLNPA